MRRRDWRVRGVVAVGMSLFVVQCAGMVTPALAGSSPFGPKFSFKMHRYGKKAGQDSPFAATFDQICDAVKKGFYDKKLNGVNWDKLTATYKARLTLVKDKPAFAVLVNSMLQELHASHMAYFTDDDAEYYMFDSVISQDIRRNVIDHIGVSGAVVGNEYVVRAVMDGGPAEQAGIQAHDHLQLADGKLLTTAGSFRGKAGMPVSVQFQRPGEDKARTVMVTPVHSNVVAAFLQATEKSAKVLTVGDRRIGYVHLWTMSNEAFKTLLNNLVTGKLHETDGLILDLRDGYGGTPFGYTDVFYRPDVSWEQTGQNGVTSLSHTGYGKPIVVLINDGTRSAKEFFTYQMKIGHRATIVGTRTAGAFLGAVGHKIGTEGMVEMAGVGLKVDGKLLENNGVEPDIVVAQKDIYTDKDAQMEQAKKTILTLIPKDAPKAKGPEVIRVH